MKEEAPEIRSIHEPAAVIAAKVQTGLAAGARTVLVIDPAEVSETPALASGIRRSTF